MRAHCLFSLCLVILLWKHSLCSIDIGAILPVSTLPAGPLYSALVRLAVQQINKNGIQGQQLNVDIVDSKSDPTTSIFAAIELGNTSAVIGEYSSTLTEYVQFVLMKYGIPQVSPSATNSTLSDTTQYPTLVRTVGSNVQEAASLISLVRAFGWSQVTIISDANDLYSIDLSSQTISQAATAHVSVAAHAIIGIQDVDVGKAITAISGSSSLVVVLVTGGSLASQILQAAAKAGILGNGAAYTWILGDAAAAQVDTEIGNENYKDPLSSFMVGCIGVVPSAGRGSTAFADFLSLLELNKGFDSALSLGRNTYIDRFAVLFYDSVFLLADTFSNVISKGGSVYDGVAVLHALKNSNFSGIAGNPYSGKYDIMNWRRPDSGFDFVTTWDPTYTVPPSFIIFADGTTNIPRDVSNDILIGVIYPFSTLVDLTHNWYSVTKLAFDDINNAGIIPGFKMRAIYTDDASSASVGIKSAIDLLTSDVVAILGPLQSSVAEPVAQVLSTFEVPLLSFGATTQELSDKTQYPYFVRNVPPDNLQTRVIVQLLLKFGWRRVAVLNTREQYGTGDAQTFTTECLQYGIDVVTQQSFTPATTDLSNVFNQIKAAQVRVIVTFLEVNSCFQTFVEAERAGVLAEGWAFVTSDTCTLFGADALVPVDDRTQFHEDIVGILSVIPFAGGGDSYTAFVSRLASLNSTVYPNLLPLVQFATYGYDAPWMYAYAFKALLSNGISFSNGTALLEQLYLTNFTGITGTTLIDANGDRVGPYTILNWQCYNCSDFTTVGYWDPTSPLDIQLNESTLVFLGGANNIPSDTPPGAGISILQYMQTLSIGLGFITGACIIVWGAITTIFVLNHKLFAIYNRLFCSYILIGVAIGYVSVLTVFPMPTKPLCMAFPWLSGIAFVLVYWSIFVKSFGLWRVFRISERMKRGRVSCELLQTALAVGVVIEICFLIAWTVLAPSTVDLMPTFSVGTSYYACNSSGQWWIGYIVPKVAQLAFGIFLAFKLRNIWDEFNESKAIALCIYNAAIVGIIAIPLGFVLKPINGADVVIQTVALLLAFTFPLIAIFVPKILRLNPKYSEGKTMRKINT